jgi:hypothetical protein
MSAYHPSILNSLVQVQVAISLLRLLLFVARPKTFILGNIPNSMIYRNVEQYTNTSSVPGVLILEIDAPIYFANASYLRERCGLIKLVFLHIYIPKMLKINQSNPYLTSAIIFCNIH